MNSFSQDFRNYASDQPDNIALMECINGRSWTWAELDILVDQIGGWLRANEIHRGQSIVSILPNAAETLTIFLACIRYGVRMAPVSPQSTMREIDNWLQMVRPAGIVKAIDNIHSFAEYKVREIEIELDSAFGWCAGNKLEVPEGACGSLCIPTSGTTGIPKPLVHDAGLLWESAKRFIAHHPDVRGGRYLNNLPMSYLGGMFNLGLIPLAGGGSTVLVPEFSGQSFFNYWREIERLRVDVLWLVPTIVRGLMAIARRTSDEFRDVISKQVRFGFLGTAPIDLQTKRDFEETFNIQLLENFGLSETTFITSESLNENAIRSEGSVGRKLPYTDIELRPLDREAGEDAAEALQVFARTPFMANGYLQADGTISDPRGPDGYLATEDLGFWDDAGNLVLAGRSRDIIKKGGMLVSLRELEVVAEALQGVDEAAAIPVPHDFYGESTVLFVRLRDDAEASEEAAMAALEGHLEANLSKHKLPDAINPIAKLPKTASGKIMKTVLASNFLDPSNR